MRQASPFITAPGGIGVNIDSFRRHLAAENLFPRTVKARGSWSYGHRWRT
jgi:hypothetical protein